MKIGRNEPCSCGSGKKYKKCCIFSDNMKNIDLKAKKVPAIQQNTEKPDDDVLDMLYKGLTGFRSLFLNKKPHIKEYRKIRKLHEEVVESMLKYHSDGKFELKITKDFVPDVSKPSEIKITECHFDFNTREGSQAFGDMIIYKLAPNMNCITEEYINKKRFRKPDKVEFLHAMLASKIGLYEILETDMDNAYVNIRDVFTGEEIMVTDVAMSGNMGPFESYIYTRIITFNGISFNTGLSLAFNKNDPFIKNHIQKYKKDYNKLGEYGRFIELYNRYSTSTDRVEVVAHSRR